MGRPLDAKATRDIVADYLTWQVIVNGGASILEGSISKCVITSRFGDALAVHAAQLSGTEVPYSEDLSDGQMYGSVGVINPFKSSV